MGWSGVRGIAQLGDLPCDGTRSASWRRSLVDPWNQRSTIPRSLIDHGEGSMSDIQRIESPDRRFFIVLATSEMRMSHWVTSAALWAYDPQRLLLEIGDWQWSSEQITWSANSQYVAVGLRRYPGDAPGIVLDIYPDRQIVLPRA